MKHLFDITMAAARRPTMRIQRSYPMTLRQRILLRIAHVAITLCSFGTPQQQQTRAQLLQRLDGFYTKGY
jgi:hypothetical protein